MTLSSGQSIVRAVEAHIDEVINLAREVCEIPAPPFGEELRAAFVHHHFQADGFDSAIDDIGNVVARCRGAGTGTLMLTAHTDTVFPVDVDVSVRREGNRLVGPGIGDNSLSVAALLMVPRILDDVGITIGPDLLLCANVGEEGLGDLRGIRRLVADHRDGLTGVVVIEGHALGHVVNAGIGSRRLRVTVEAPGGHSWGKFGTPSAIHVLGGIISDIARLSVPAEPKASFNVGQIEGGVSVNTIAPRASLTLDLRSVDASTLDDLAARVEEILRAAENPAQGVAVRREVIGDRPAGTLSEKAPIVQTALAVRRELGLEPKLEASSTDANIPIAEGIPAVCIGLTTGGNTHREDEYIELKPLPTGLTQLVLLLSRLG